MPGYPAAADASHVCIMDGGVGAANDVVWRSIGVGYSLMSEYLNLQSVTFFWWRSGHVGLAVAFQMAHYQPNV